MVGLTAQMGCSLRIRAATGADATEVARLCAQLGYPVADAVMRQRIEQLAESSAFRLVVAEGVPGLLGWACAEVRVSLESGTRVELTGLVVDAASRRGGVGRAMVADIERWAQAQRCPEIVVRSNVARLESHPFYEGLGYRCAKTQRVYTRALVGE